MTLNPPAAGGEGAESPRGGGWVRILDLVLVPATLFCLFWALVTSFNTYFDGGTDPGATADTVARFRQWLVTGGLLAAAGLGLAMLRDDPLRKVGYGLLFVLTFALGIARYPYAGA